jgi:arylsulfatase A-like enzyme
VILVDDQDYHLGSMDYMYTLQSQLVQQGVMFTNHYGHVSQCCPARATLWTGKHAHNTNVTSVLNGQPGGAWRQIQAKGWYKKYLPVWVQQAGYRTYYSGKIFNGYGTRSYCDPVCLEGWARVRICWVYYQLRHPLIILNNF